MEGASLPLAAPSASATRCLPPRSLLYDEDNYDDEYPSIA